MSFFVCALCLSGCVAFREPVLAKLPENIPLSWTANTGIESLPVTASLVDLIGEDPILRLLIDEAVNDNPNLKATAIRLKSAGYMLAGLCSKRLPQVNTEFSKGRDNQEADAETGKRKTSDSHQRSLSVSWELDIWGRLADEYSASEKAVLSQEYDYLHIRDALVAERWSNRIDLALALGVGVDERTAMPLGAKK